LGAKYYAAPMPSESGPASAPQSPGAPNGRSKSPDEEAPLREVIAYGSGAVPNELMGSTFNNLAHPVLNMTLGVSPAIVGLLLSFRGIWDAFTDPVMAYFSDNFKSRWGRRRPFIFAGGLTMLLLGSLAWFIPRSLSELGIAWYFGVMMVLFATAQTVYSVPYWAQGIELSPTYHGRTRVALVRTLFQRVVAFSGP
jgi:GPH family glycoside/pentoside/hexuronide:cation symporter